MRKTKLLLAACAMLGVMTANADVMLETDLTSSFNSLATTKWTGSSGQVGWAAPQVTTNSGLTVAAWESYCGDWNGGCTNTGSIMSTTVTGLVPGTYKIELYGAAAFTYDRGFGSEAFTGDLSKATSDTYTAGQSIDTETGVSLYATTSEGEYSKEIPIWYADNFNGSGLSTVVLEGVVVGANGNIEIGMTKTSKSTNWHVVQLKGVTATVSGDAAITALKATATSLLADAKYVNVTGAERTKLEAANAATPAEETEEAYKKVIADLNTAISAFEGCDYAAYDNYVAYKAETVAAFGSDLGVAAPTTAAEAMTAVQALNIAQYNKVASEYTFSCSGLIGDFGSWTGTATVAGSPAEPNYLDYEHWSGVTHAYYEQAAAGWDNSNGWTIQYQKTCTLPAGDYVIKVAARSSAETTSLVSCSATPNTVTLPNVGASAKGINKAGEASWTDGEFVNGGTGFGWQWRFLPFTLADETEVTMTFYAEATSLHQWMSIADGELLSKTKLAEDVNYTETASNAITDKLIADVTITRDIKEGFNTVVLPFDATANQVTEVFGAGTKVYNFSEASADANNATVTFQSGDGSISANVPVLIKATVASSEQVFKGVKVVAPTADVKVAGTNFDFVGTYAPIATIVEGDYFVGDGKLFKSAGSTSMSAFRAYIKTKAPTARIANFVIGDEATGISEMKVAANDKAIFNLQGQRVKKAQKGLFIQNGKKVIIK
jgi:hypothetical protein